MKIKKKKLGGVEYFVLGATIERVGITVVKKSYTTTTGVVVIENHKVLHPNGNTTDED